jgi:hydrogenase expression/formation protein HypE
MTQESDISGWACPTPFRESERILMGHGSGGRMSADLLQQVFLPELGNEVLSALEDQATLRLVPETADRTEGTSPRLAFTTDAFVVNPLFFPGGDIGKLAVHGTINDLAVGGAVPRFLSAAFILEEGLPLQTLQRIVASVGQACRSAGVVLVTGDTKVVDRGKCDQIFITTSGVGWVPHGRQLSVRHARPGDHILVSGTIGDHGIAIMSIREGLEFETLLESDTAPLHTLTEVMLSACPNLRWMRDPTRGGVSSTLHELAVASQVGVKIREASLPVRPEVHAACEMLGLDPLYVANEGKLIAVVPPEQSSRLLNAMLEHPLGRHAAVIGEVVAEHPGLVVMRSVMGGERVVTLLSGEQLPRIC